MATRLPPVGRIKRHDASPASLAAASPGTTLTAQRSHSSMAAFPCLPKASETHDRRFSSVVVFDDEPKSARSHTPQATARSSQARNRMVDVLLSVAHADRPGNNKEPSLGSAFRHGQHLPVTAAQSVASNQRPPGSIAASNRSQAMTDVVHVGEVDKDDRDLLEEGDKRARRVVYDLVRSSVPELSKGRGRIVPLEIESAVISGGPSVAPTLDFSHLGITKIMAILRREPRAGTRIKVDNGRRKGRGDSPRDASGTQPGDSMGGRHGGFAALPHHLRNSPASLGKPPRAANAPPPPPPASCEDIPWFMAGRPNDTGQGGNQPPQLKPGTQHMWGVKTGQGQDTLIIIKARDSTYVIDRDSLEDEDDAAVTVRGRKSELVTVSDAYFNAMQMDLVEAVPDAPRLMFLMEREARAYEYEAAVRRIVLHPYNAATGTPVDAARYGADEDTIVAAVVGANASPLNIVQYAQSLPPAPQYSCGALCLSGNQLRELSVVSLARTLIYSTMEHRTATHASFVDYRHTAVSMGNDFIPGKLHTVLPFQFLSILDLSGCGLRHIRFPFTVAHERALAAAPAAAGAAGAKPSAARSAASLAPSATVFGGVDVADHPPIVLTETRCVTSEGATQSLLDPLVAQDSVPEVRGAAKQRAAINTVRARHTGSPHLLARIPDVPKDLADHVTKHRHERLRSHKKDREASRSRSASAAHSEGGDSSDFERGRSHSRRHTRRASSFVRFGNPDLPYRGKIAHWTLAPCAPLRFLTTLLLHGNLLDDYREALTFAYMSRNSLRNLTWHGNPGIDAAGAEASAAAKALLPKLSSLNYTRLTRTKDMGEQRSMARK